ncbi:MAG: efflux RND transporter periplasmic adaptor subunit [Granulosicoccus sp.]|nr:efflux RND transporter periplasmic adaptor subunit [Granulosicoccus sp.]
MKLFVKILIPVAVLLVAWLIARSIISSGPEPRTRPSFSAAQSVEAVTLKREDYQVRVLAQGTVRPARESALVPEVTGVIKTLSPNLVKGGFFTKGELLLAIDEQDYAIALAQAEAGYAQASAVLQEEKARAAQAVADWKSLGRKGKPSGLTAREPQLAAARASLAAAKASVQQARLDVARTQINAPYDGGVLEIDVDEGGFVSRGMTLGKIYSTGAAEVRLPLADRQLTYLTLPNPGENTDKPSVILRASIGGREQTWEGSLIRAEGVDATSQQLNVVALVENPFVVSADSTPLRVGQFVSAEIHGDLLQQVFVIPASSLREGGEVLLVDDENTLRKRAVTVAWTDDEFVAITEGLNDGDVLTLTTLSAVTDGTPVRATIDGVAPKNPRGGSAIAGSRSNRSESGGNTDDSQGSNGIGDDRAARMEKLKAMVDNGEALPDDVVKRVQARLDAGERVPPWLKAAVMKQ